MNYSFREKWSPNPPVLVMKEKIELLICIWKVILVTKYRIRKFIVLLILYLARKFYVQTHWNSDEIVISCYIFHLKLGLYDFGVLKQIFVRLRDPLYIDDNLFVNTFGNC